MPHRLPPVIDIKATMSDNYEAKFFEQYGSAMAAWSTVEHALSQWFSYATITAIHKGVWQTRFNMYPTSKIFNSARSFDGKIAMLTAAFSTIRREDGLSAFFKTAIKLACEYSQFRNQMAHGITVNKLQANQMEIQHLDDAFGKKSVIRQIELENGSGNFDNLTRLLMFTLPQPEDFVITFGKTSYSPKVALDLLKTMPKKANEPPAAKIPFPSF